MAFENKASSWFFEIAVGVDTVKKGVKIGSTAIYTNQLA